MTLDRSGDGTGVYIPPSGNGPNIDAFGLAKPASVVPFQSGQGAVRFNIYNTETLPDGGERRYWRLEVYDLRQGFRQRGRFERDHGAVATSTMSHYFEEQAVLPFLTTGDSTYNPGIGTTGLVQRPINVFNTFAIGLVDQVAALDTFLYKETSSTNPVLTQITYSKSKALLSLSRIVMNGTEYCAVGFATGGCDMLTDLVTGGPTSAGTMDASTGFCTGMIQTFLPGNPILITANTQMLSLPSNVAIGTAPTVALSYFPTGGYPLGLASLGGGPVRAWWLAPRVGNTYIGGSINTGAPFWSGHVISTDQSGTTPSELTLPLYNVQSAALYRDGIVASDETRIVFHNGRFIRDLRIFKDVSVASDKQYKVASLYVNGPSLWAEVNIIATSFGTYQSQRCVWYYDYDLDAWFQVSATSTVVAGGMISAWGPGGVSQQTGFLHIRALDATTPKFWRIFQPPYGVTPFAYRKTVGATATTGTAYEASGAITLTLNELPGLEGLPKVIRSVQFMGDVDAGGTGGTPAKVNVTAPGIDTSAHSLGDFQTATSVNGLQRRDFEDNVISFYKFQPTITATQQSGGTDPTLFTPQVLPIAFEGYADWRPWYAPPTREEVNS